MIANSPWIGEHLSWLGTEPGGSLGYQINPLFVNEFAEITVLNVRRLREYYERPIALELSPVYISATGYESEMHFLGAVADATDTGIILDLSHWQIGNRNLDQPDSYGLDALNPDRIRELHVAGMRQGKDQRFWHDAHEVLPNDTVLEWTARLVRPLKCLTALEAGPLFGRSWVFRVGRRKRWLLTFLTSSLAVTTVSEFGPAWNCIGTMHFLLLTKSMRTR